VYYAVRRAWSDRIGRSCRSFPQGSPSFGTLVAVLFVPPLLLYTCAALAAYTACLAVVVTIAHVPASATKAHGPRAAMRRGTRKASGSAGGGDHAVWDGPR
jgi:hypothetical protein